MSSNFEQKFLKLLDKEFPPSHVLHNIFNRNTVKISYRCMRNIKSIIDTHYKKVLTEHTQPTNTSRKCNCRRAANCPMEGQCLSSAIIYQATVTSPDSTETYIGSTATDFKARYNNHTASFRHSSKRSATELSKHIWALKYRNITYNLNWKIVRRAAPCNSGNSSCGLCLTEKFYIIFQRSMASLNDRRALVSTCRHSSKKFSGKL